MCGCIYKVRKEEGKDYFDLVNIEHQKVISHSVTGWLSLILACQGCCKCTELHIHTSCPLTSRLLFWNVFRKLWANSLRHLQWFIVVCNAQYFSFIQIVCLIRRWFWWKRVGA